MARSPQGRKRHPLEAENGSAVEIFPSVTVRAVNYRAMVVIAALVIWLTA